MVDEALTAGAVARRLGIAVTTLRTWHQRYGLGPSEHVPGHHRRYTGEDLDRLEVMRRLTTEGVPAAEAAAWARRVPTSPPPSIAEPASRDGGGRTIALGAAVPAARGLARAAMRLDGPAMRNILETVIAERGVIETWNEVAAPVLIGVGERYESTKGFVEIEHLISRCVTEALSAVPRPPPSVSPRILLAAADEEQHTLPLEALAAALAQQGIPSRLLGARVPPEALAGAIARTGPAAVVLWSQLPQTGDPAQLARIADSAHRPLVIAAAGPGWPIDLPPGIARPADLRDAVELIRAA